MTGPLNVSRYIKLITKEALDRKDIKNWLDTITQAGPPGVVAAVHTTDAEGSPRSVKVVHRETDAGHSYMVALTRDLTSEETARLVQHFADEHPDLDFDIETHERSLDRLDRRKISLDQGAHLRLCAALAKQKHEDWVRERADAGWRYGPTFSTTNKTHPLLRPWDQIPDRYRVPDLEWPQKLVNVLGSEGYVVVAKDELDRLLNLLRGTV